MRTWAAWCAGAVLLAATAARADTCPVPDGANARLATIDSRERIEFLHHVMQDQARYARTWKWAWFGIGTATFASSAAQAIGWAAGNDKTREANVIDNLVVSGFSIVTPIFSLLFALRVEDDAPAVDQLLRETGGGEAGSCLVLARIEELFAKDAAEESFNTGVLTQVTAILGVGAMFAIMAVEAATSTDPAVRDAHWFNAVGNGVAGLILTESQILTTPTGAVSAYQRYLRGKLPRPALTMSLVPLIATPGLAFKVSF